MIIETIGALPLSQVHQLTLQPWINAQKGIRASGTVGRTLRTVTAVLNYAARVLRDEEGMPWLRYAVPKLQAPDWGTRQPVRLTWDEQDRLIAALDYPRARHLITPVLFALYTGGRQEEIVSLRWSQLEERNDLPEYAAWWIPPEIRKSNSRKAASDQDGRYLVCNAMARSVIETQKNNGSAFVFPGPTGDRVGVINNSGWRSALKRAELKIRFHDLRHTFGERMADAGIPFDARKSLLGHEHRDITAHYSSPGIARLLEEAERVRRPGATLSRVPKRHKNVTISGI